MSGLEAKTAGAAQGRGSRPLKQPAKRGETGGTAIVVVPAAGRLVSSLRDLGYDFVQAVADLVDNSIAASASSVEIDLRFEGESSWLRISDDGRGMDEDEITEAMRYGSDSTYGSEELGKFGLGLKTASMSQCRRLTVLSRPTSRRTAHSARRLDLDHVLRVNRWEITAPGRGEIAPEHYDLLSTAAGTVVVWEHLDRLMGFKLRTGGHARNAISAMADQLAEHLSMVFHRYLDGEVPGRRRLQLKVNGRRLKAWDPFGRREAGTLVLPAKDFVLEAEGRHGVVRFQPYVLPTRSGLSVEAFERLGGPSRWNSQQGLYVYRANRMIQSGGWNRMRAPDEHVKLARASIDFFPELDSKFGVSVAKARVSLPDELRRDLRGPIEGLVATAQAAYRSSAEEHGTRASMGASASTRRERDGGQTFNTDSIRSALEDAATQCGQSRALDQIARLLRVRHPHVAAAIGMATD